MCVLFWFDGFLWLLMGNEECLHIMYMILYMWLLIRDTTVNWPANCAMTGAVILWP